MEARIGPAHGSSLSQLEERHEAAVQAAESERDLCLVIRAWRTLPRRCLTGSTSSTVPGSATLSAPSSSALKWATMESRSYSEYHRQMRRSGQPHSPKTDPLGNNVKRFVERTFAWMTRCRRLVKDYERYAETLAGFQRARGRGTGAPLRRHRNDTARSRRNLAPCRKGRTRRAAARSGWLAHDGKAHHAENITPIQLPFARQSSTWSRTSGGICVRTGSPTASPRTTTLSQRRLPSMAKAHRSAKDHCFNRNARLGAYRLGIINIDIKGRGSEGRGESWASMIRHGARIPLTGQSIFFGSVPPVCNRICRR